MDLSFVHASSESGDHYYFVFKGRFTSEEALRAAKEDMSGHDDADYIYIDHIETVNTDDYL